MDLRVRSQFKPQRSFSITSRLSSWKLLTELIMRELWILPVILLHSVFNGILLSLTLDIRNRGKRKGNKCNLNSIPQNGKTFQTYFKVSHTIQFSNKSSTLPKCQKVNKKKYEAFCKMWLFILLFHSSQTFVDEKHSWILCSFFLEETT